MANEKTDRLTRLVTFPVKIIKPIQDFLVNEVRKLEKRQEEYKKSDPFADANRVIDNADPDEEADEQIGHEKMAALRQEIDRRMIQLRKALTRVKLGAYGTCEECGKMIDTDRLMIMPEATICIDCEKKKEE